LKLEQQALKDSFDDLRLFIKGPVGDELDSFNEKQGELKQEAGELRAEIVKLEGLPQTKESVENLEKVRGKLGEVNKAIDENIKAHDEAQKRIVFDLLAQQAAADDLTEAEVKGLTEVAKQFGLIDEETARVTEELSGHLEQLAEDENIYRFGQNVEETVDGIGEDTDEVMLYFDEWKEAIAEIEGMHPIEFVITQSGELPKGVTVTTPTTGHPDHPAQYGADFVVPPGFPNDSYPMRVTSGEHVQVTPQGQTRESEPVIVINANIAGDTDVEDLALRLAEVYRTRME